MPYDVQATIGGTAYSASLTPECGWNTTTRNTWCPDSWFWRQQAGSGSDTEQAITACNWFLNNGYHMVDQRVIRANGQATSTPGLYTWNGNFSQAWRRQRGDTCPANRTQVMEMQGDDYFYALYDPAADQHQIIALTDPTVSAAQGGGTLAFGESSDNTPNSSWVNGTGEISTLNYVPGAPSVVSDDHRTQWERGWFLARYQHDFALTGANLTSNTFEYRGALSVPQDEVTYEGSSQGTSTSRGFSVGIFGNDPNVTYSDTVTEDANVSINVPNWEVQPKPGPRSISYEWTTNTPISYTTITAGGQGPWGINSLAVRDFNPGSLTAWVGDATWGPVSMESNRTLTFADHYSLWDGGGQLIDRFQMGDLAFSFSPDAVNPPQGNAKNPNPTAGINLCDPLVGVERFKSQCAS